MEPDPVTGGRRFVVTRNAMDQPIADTDGDGIVEVIGETDINNLDFIGQRPALVSQGVARARRSSLVHVLTGDPLVSGTEIATPGQDHTAILTPGDCGFLLNGWTMARRIVTV